MHPQSAERMEELEGKVWSVVRQKNESENTRGRWTGQGYSVRPALLYEAETWALNPMYEN